MSTLPASRPRTIKHRLVRALLDVAQERLAQEAGRPRQTVLRRCTSDAYYGVFHGLCYLAADGTVGWNVPWDRFEPIYRSIDHQETKRRLEANEIRNLHPDVKRISEIFRTLMKERHTADYDPRPFTRSKSEAALLVALAGEAIELIESLPEETYRTLAVLLVAKPRRT